MRGLAGKVVVVTGAAQGLGRAYAARLATEGCRVVLADVEAERGEAAARDIRDSGGEAVFCPVDVADAASCDRLAEAALAAFGQVDALVNNAAVFTALRLRPFWEIDVEEWDHVQAVNVRGVWLATRALLPALRRSAGASVVNISSAVVWLGRAGYLHYVASKAAVVGMTGAMARELGPDRIRVNAITPGPVTTEVPRDTVTPEQRAALLRAQAIPHEAVPGDLEGTVLFLVSEESAFLTGQTINVDGGMTVRWRT